MDLYPTLITRWTWFYLVLRRGQKTKKAAATATAAIDECVMSV
jgi:hypothetical protein